MRQRAIAAALLELNADRPQGVPSVAAKRRMPYRPDELPASAVYRAREVLEDIHGRQGGSRIRTLAMVIEHRATTEEALEPMLANATASLEGNRLIDDEGPISTEIEEELTEWDLVEISAEAEFALARQRFLVSYQTARGSQVAV